MISIVDWPTAVVIVAIILLCAVLIYVMFKYGKDKQTGQSNLLPLILMFFMLLLALFEFWGILPQGWNQSHWWVHLLLGICLLASVFYLRYLYSPKDAEELKPRLEEVLSKTNYGRLHSGPGYGVPISSIITREAKGPTGLYNKIYVYLVRATEEQALKFYMIGINSFSTKLEFFHEDPSYKVIEKEMTREIAIAVEAEKAEWEKALAPDEKKEGEQSDE